MRIVATSDTHFPFNRDLIPDGDVLLHAGDLMYYGDPGEWVPRLESMEDQPHKSKIYVPGNHDYYPFHYRGIARSTMRREANTVLNDGYDGVISLGKGSGINMLAIPYVTGLPGWAYNVEEDWLEGWLRRISMSFFDPTVVVSHSPPWRIRDACGKENFGSTAMNKWFYGLKHKPKLWICGHIHDSYGQEEIEGCTFANVAMCDEKYKQVNPAMVFDL